MLRLYFDEDVLEKALIEALWRAGFDCLPASEAEMRKRSDAEQLAFASREGRVIFTRNTADYRRLDAAWAQFGRAHSGIIVLNRQRIAIGVQVRAFQSLAEKLSQSDMENRLEFLLNYVAR